MTVYTNEHSKNAVVIAVFVDKTIPTDAGGDIACGNLSVRDLKGEQLSFTHLVINDGNDHYRLECAEEYNCCLREYPVNQKAEMVARIEGVCDLSEGFIPEGALRDVWYTEEYGND